MTTLSSNKYTRSDDWFESEGLLCAAAVYRPFTDRKNSPAIVMGHGFGTPRALGLYRYAEEFAQAGYIVVVFDYRYFGESQGQPRQLLDINKQLEDWRRAVAFTRTLEGVDSQRIVGWGTSFAGGHVLTLAGRGEDFAAIVTQVPHVSGPAAVRATGLKSSLRVAPSAAIDLLRGLLGKEPRYIDSVGNPGDVAVMSSPDAMSGKDRLIEASGVKPGDYPETVAARVLARIGFYSPGRTAHRISCPSLVQIMTGDAVTPAIAAVKAALKIPNATVRLHNGGHFDPYVDPKFKQIIAEQLEFLNSVVPLTE
ncbi:MULTISPECIES: alpha/beta hydrolase [unclassified Corynebacterium]|uniref:alpha/beta hydrolase n=1 Tax=unclassified Corynebacterium TaxID=2624378 RepID=UPI0030A785F0